MFNANGDRERIVENLNWLWAFCLDLEDNILWCNRSSGVVQVLSLFSGEVASFGDKTVAGTSSVCYDSSGRVVIALDKRFVVYRVKVHFRISLAIDDLAFLREELGYRSDSCASAIIDNSRGRPSRAPRFSQIACTFQLVC